MNKKILFIVTDLGIGGLEMYLLRFLSFSNNRIQASILSKSGKPGELDNKFSNLNTTLIHFLNSNGYCFLCGIGKVF